MAQLVGTLAELVVEQGAIERELYKVLHLRFGAVGIEIVGGERHECTLARLLLDDGDVTILYVQQVESSLNTQYLTKERWLKHYGTCIELFYLLW